MKNTLLLLVLVSAILFACTSDDLDPEAGFTFGHETTSTFAMGTYDRCSLFNNSKNSRSISWDFGDGRSSNDQDVVLSYEKSGTYNVALTVTGKNGQKSTVSKTVIVKDRVLRAIEFSYVKWQANLNGWPPSSEADIYLQIQKYTDITVSEGFFCLSCPVVYTSPVVKEVELLETTPVTIPVNEKVIIDKTMIRVAWPQHVDHAYLISLMAKDENGNVYCLQSSRAGGSYLGISSDNFAKNEFIVHGGGYSPGISIRYLLICDFE